MTVGRAVPRREDARLLTGRGTYVDDVRVRGTLHAAFVRSPLGRAHMLSVDVSKARSLEGVHAVFTGADLNPLPAGSLLPTLFADGSQGPSAPIRPLAEADVRFAGDPVAVVVADSRYIAEDACELVSVEYEPLSAVVNLEGAAGAEAVHPELGTNVALRMASRPKVDTVVEEVLATSAHVITETFVQQRQAPSPLETRGILAWWEPRAGEFRVWVSSQNPHEVRQCCARVLGLPLHRVHVTQQDVGGAFGLKYYLHREEIVVVLAAHLLARPVKWVEDRRENLLASHHARSDRARATLAFDGDGRVTAARIDHLEEAGAYPMGGTGGTGPLVAHLFPGPYRVPKLAWSTTSVFTNTCGRGSYRGPWMMETVARERLLDVAARRMGVDPLELRRRNVIRRDEFPYRSAGRLVYDCVSPAETLEQAANLVDYTGFRQEQAVARTDGRYLGIGLALYVEPQAGVGGVGVEAVTVRVEPDGTVTVLTGSGATGQGLETTSAQVVAEHLGVEFDAVVVRQGDTAACPFGGGTGGSRSAPIGAAAAQQAAVAMRERVLTIASHVLDSKPRDLEVSGGVIRDVQNPGRSMTVAEVAAAAYHRPATLPPGTESGLEVTTRFKAPPIMLSNACHACTCEVDVATGLVRLLRYVVSEDCGVVINPLVVSGQVAGGVAQGIGGALFEQVAYGSDGTPLTTSFREYLLPQAGDVPPLELGHVVTPGLTPGNHKGMGESGAIGSPPAVCNAVADALSPFGVEPTRTPLTPSYLLDLIEEAAGDVKWPGRSPGGPLR